MQAWTTVVIAGWTISDCLHKSVAARAAASTQDGVGGASTRPCTAPLESSGAATCIAQQVRLLYGPLLACVTASKSAFTAMVQQHGDGDTASFVRAARENPEGPQGKIYRCAPADSASCMEAERIWMWGFAHGAGEPGGPSGEVYRCAPAGSAHCMEV